MDASAYLKAQGWRGDGHSLDSTDRGIRKPLLVSKKVDVLGVGVNKHAAVSDQWWMRAYDSGLKDLGSGKKSTLATVREQGMYAGGLYGRFVKGEGIEGTFDPTADENRKRKREEEDSGYESQKKAKRDAATKKLKKSVDKKVDAFVAEAQKRGLLEAGEKKAKYPSSSKTVVALFGEPAVLDVFQNAGLGSGSGSSKASSTKEQKYSREKQTRELKKVAKKHILTQLSEIERKQLQDGEGSTKLERTVRRQAKEADKVTKLAAKAAAKEAKALRKQEKKASKGTKAIKPKDAIPAEVGFVVDTTGDASLTREPPTPNQVVESEGNVRFTVVAEIPVPLDPTIWEGIDVKTLPRPVREARRKWMQEKRKAKKEAKGDTSTSGDKKKSKGEKKVLQREALAKQILLESRNSAGKGTATIDGIENVPLLKLDSKSKGKFSKEGMVLARSAARKALKAQKRAKEANEEKQSNKKRKDAAA